MSLVRIAPGALAAAGMAFGLAAQAQVDDRPLTEN